MTNINVDKTVKENCEKFVEKYSVANRGVADGNKEQQVTGLIGEVTVKLFYGYTPLFSIGFDDGYDLELNGYKIDVKTMGRTTPPKDYYVNNFISLQEHFDCDVYMFCSYNKIINVLTICGWVTKEQLFERANKFKKGASRKRSNGSSFILKADTYEIENKQLNDLKQLELFLI